MLSARVRNLLCLIGLLTLLANCAVRSNTPNPEQAVRKESKQNSAQLGDLLKSVRSGDAIAVKQLLAAGVNPNVGDARTGHTPLMIAVIRGDRAIASELLNAGADVDAIAGFDTAYISALKAAVEGEKADMVDLLLERGARVDKKDYFGRTLLHSAAERGNIEIINALLTKGVDINSKDNQGITPLINAVRGDKLESVKLLLNKGADINLVTKKGWTPLMQAVTSQSTDVVQLLIEHGADVNAKDIDDWTALRQAFLVGCPDIIELLEKGGAKE